MAKKILGFIELVWDCDSCGTTNPGAIKTCSSCGAPQPPNVQFKHVDPQSFNFIKDQALIRAAQSGPDKHCPYCGTRNSADTSICTNCGGDLTIGATSRPVQIIEDSFQEGILPPSQGPMQSVPAPKAKMSLPVKIILVLIVIAFCAGIAVFFTKMNQTDAITGTVSGVSWQHSIQMQGYQSVAESDWLDQIPQGASPYNCEQRYRYSSEKPVANSREVCGEPYTVDTGTGIGRVQQDCHYEVYDDYCSYNTMAWVPVETLVENGTDLSPYWPEVTTSSTLRIGEQKESYTIQFDADGSTYSITTTDLELFQQALPNSRWTLEVNAFGNVRSANPVSSP